jgi:hypothetical protein
VNLPFPTRSDRTTVAVREQSRRDILAKTGLAAGAIGLGILAKAPPALATDGTGLDFEDLQFEGFNNVQDPQFAGGAKGDGTTDDTLAIDACIQASREKATVYFPPGTYIITRDNPGVLALVLPDDTHLLGSGPLSVLKRGGGDPGGALLLRRAPTGSTDPYGDGGQNNRIENLVLDGNRGDTNNQTSWLINLTGSRIFIRGVEGRNCGTAFSFQCSLKDSAIQDCFVHDGGSDGLNLDGDNLVVQGNLIRDCDDDHIVVNAPGGRRISIVGNVSDKTNISANSLPGEGSQRGGAIVLRGGSQGHDGVTISGNVCHGGPQAAIAITSQFGPVHDVLVSNNVLVNPGFSNPYGVPNGSGIALFAPTGPQELQDMQNVRITENLVINPHMHGIMIKPPENSDGGSITDVTISRNTIWMGAKTEGTLRSGIACNLPQRPVRNLAVVGNDIRDATGPGIDIERDTTAAGAVVERCCVEGNRIINSGTAGTPQPGIRIDNVFGVVVTGNRATDTQSGASKTQDFGVRDTELTGPVLVTRNVFTDNRNDHTIDLPPPSGPGPSLLGIRDNPGFNPWAGDVSLALWSSGPPYVTEASVSFGVAFPAAPQVICTVKPGTGTSLDAYAVAKDVTQTGFTLRVISNSAPGASPHKASWMAEPSA